MPPTPQNTPKPTTTNESQADANEAKRTTAARFLRRYQALDSASAGLTSLLSDLPDNPNIAEGKMFDLAIAAQDKIHRIRVQLMKTRQG